MQDSFLWYFIKENTTIVRKIIKYIITEPRFWLGFGFGGLFMMSVDAL